MVISVTSSLTLRRSTQRTARIMSEDLHNVRVPMSVQARCLGYALGSLSVIADSSIKVSFRKIKRCSVPQIFLNVRLRAKSDVVDFTEKVEYYLGYLRQHYIVGDVITYHEESLELFSDLLKRDTFVDFKVRVV